MNSCMSGPLNLANFTSTQRGEKVFSIHAIGSWISTCWKKKWKLELETCSNPIVIKKEI